MKKVEDEKLQFIIDLLMKQEERLDSMSTTLVGHKTSLDEHMRRTELLEIQISPLSKLYQQGLGVLKVIAGLGVVATILSTISKLKG